MTSSNARSNPASRGDRDPVHDSGFTDAKYFSQTGARWYGFSPVKIEKVSGIRFADMFHGNDERVPVAGLAWGVEVLDAVVREICGS